MTCLCSPRAELRPRSTPWSRRIPRAAAEAMDVTQPKQEHLLALKGTPEPGHTCPPHLLAGRSEARGVSRWGSGPEELIWGALQPSKHAPAA